LRLQYRMVEMNSHAALSFISTCKSRASTTGITVICLDWFNRSSL
jgi:hypothetical protein